MGGAGVAGEGPGAWREGRSVRRDWRGVRNWSSWFAGGSRIWGPGDGRYGTPSRETRGRRGGLLASVGAYYSTNEGF